MIGRMRLPKMHALLAAFICAVAATPAGHASAEVKLTAGFGDHMVLHCGTYVPVWGTADPGEAVTVRVAGRERSAKPTPPVGAMRYVTDAVEPSAWSSPRRLPTRRPVGTAYGHVVRSPPRG